MKSPCHFRTLAFEERATVNPQVAFLDWTLTGIPDDVTWPLKDDNHIVSVPHHDGCLLIGLMMAWMRRLMEWLMTLQCR